MAAEIGVIGLVVFLLIVAKTLRRGFRTSLSLSAEIPVARGETGSAFHRTLALGLASGLLAFLIHSFFDTNLQSLPLVILFWFSVGLLMSVPNIYVKKI